MDIHEQRLSIRLKIRLLSMQVLARANAPLESNALHYAPKTSIHNGAVLLLLQTVRASGRSWTLETLQ